MILVIGGLASGKRTYVKNALGFRDDAMADAVLDSRPVLYNLQDLVAKDPAASLSWLPLLTEKAVVICNEVGCGIIPLAEQERVWREAVGRLCVALAEQADCVVRLYCGLPQIIKG